VVDDGQAVRQLECVAARQREGRRRAGLRRRAAPGFVLVDADDGFRLQGFRRRLRRRHVGPEVRRARHARHHHARIRLQVRLRHAPHVGRADAAQACQVARQVAGVAGVLVVLVQLVGEAGAAQFFDRCQHRRLDGIAGAFDFGVGRADVAQRLQFGVDRAFQLGAVDAGPRGGVDQEGRGERIRILRSRHVLRDLAFIDQAFIQASGLAAGQDLAGDRQLGVARLVGRRRQPGHVHARQFDAVGHRDAAFARDRRRAYRGCNERRAALEAAEVFRHQRAGPGLVDVAGDHDAGVVGAIVALEEIAHVLQFRALDVGVRADHRSVVRVVLREQRVVDRFLDDAVGPVLVALAALVAHHVLLVR
jgi:hypothetical protein